MNFILLIIMGILYLGQHWVAMGLVFLVFIFRGNSSKRCRSKSRPKKGVHKVFDIAKQNGVSIPKFHPEQKQLIDVYELYLSSKRKYPSLADHYDSIIDSLWPTLQKATTKQEWTNILLKVRKNWPQPQKVDIWDKIDEAKQAASRLQESIEEVNGQKWGPV